MATRKKTAVKRSAPRSAKVAKGSRRRARLTPKQREALEKIGRRLDDIERRLASYASESKSRGTSPLEKRFHAAAGELARVGAQAVAGLHRELEENPRRTAEWRKKLAAVVSKRFEVGLRLGKKSR